MTRRARLGLFAAGALGLAALLVWSVTGLSDFGHYPGPYGDVLVQAAPAERHVANVVAAIVYDYRALDTMGEELILFAAVAGVALMLREHRVDRADLPEDKVHDEAVRIFGGAAVGLALLIGLFTITYGYLTPGGGFQGGVAVAATFALVWAAGSYHAFHALTPEPLVDLAEGLGAGGFVVLGVIGLAASGSMFENFLPLGTFNSLLSSGEIALLNWAAGLEVAAAMTLLFAKFLEDVMVPEDDE
jgi:multicomponent Na+:H+ antiporter subunit B